MKGSSTVYESFGCGIVANVVHGPARLVELTIFVVPWFVAKMRPFLKAGAVLLGMGFLYILV